MRLAIARRRFNRSVPTTSIDRAAATLSEVPVDRLRELHNRLRTGELGELGEWAAACISGYLENAPTDLALDAAFGLVAPPGGTPWWAAEETARRDAALRALAEAHRELDVQGQAVAVLGELRRYRDSRWRTRDRARAEMPAEYVGTDSEHLWMALNSGGVPASTRQLRRILDSP